MPGSLLGFRPAPASSPSTVLTLLICAPPHIQPILHLDYILPFFPIFLFSQIRPQIHECKFRLIFSRSVKVQVIVIEIVYSLSKMLAKPRLSLLPERILPPPGGPGGAKARIRWKGSDKLRLLSRDSASWPRAPPARRVSDNGGAGGREVVRSGRYFEVWIR